MFKFLRKKTKPIRYSAVSDHIVLKLINSTSLITVTQSFLDELGFCDPLTFEYFIKTAKELKLDYKISTKGNEVQSFQINKVSFYELLDYLKCELSFTINRILFVNHLNEYKTSYGSINMTNSVMLNYFKLYGVNKAKLVHTIEKYQLNALFDSQIGIFVDYATLLILITITIPELSKYIIKLLINKEIIPSTSNKNKNIYHMNSSFSEEALYEQCLE